jgi:peptidoglycan/xylan/chitin deacetylase (PgdA/CDA1 family)
MPRSILLSLCVLFWSFTAAAQSSTRFEISQGAIVRGDPTLKQMALVFTGDEFADGGDTIALVLKQHRVKASFFFTGRFYRNPKFKDLIERLKADGHYLGAHSDQHLLYCDWSDREKLLVTKEQFDIDLNNNYDAMSAFGIRRTDARFFLPPFEWYNQTISDWSQARGLQLVNFTYGTRSNADYTTPDAKNYVNSKTILESIESYANKDAKGLNGFLLLLHVGVSPDRTDKFYNYLSELIVFLKSRQLKLMRLDELLRIR